jgi:hypothetical protein
MKLGHTMLPEAPEWCYACSWPHHYHWSTYIRWQIETLGTETKVHKFNFSEFLFKIRIYFTVHVQRLLCRVQSTVIKFIVTIIIIIICI